ncbi:hypothetical protein [Arcobacter sp. LA11]|uniref:hypothetical protein n=1 Tax=Arcobacter sp. LA11 TaxID=1898176 RepID=UPI000934D656|nr:hypothetical protein [Arcobacter sp. LA11]
MKKAIINQMFLGFILLSGIVTFIATVNDERQTRNKVYELQDLINEANKSLAQTYRRSINEVQVPNAMDAICAAEALTNTLIASSSLGAELISANQIQYTWRDSGTYDVNGNLTSGSLDQFPDNVTTTISSHQQSTFWYKLLGRDSFTIPSMSRALDFTNFDFDVTVYFRDVINAGFFNLVGTYDFDDDGCPSNPKIILDNKNNFAKGDILGEIKASESGIFFISDGYRRFGNYNSSGSGSNSGISLDTQLEFEHDCPTDPNTKPVVKVTTDTGQVERNTDGTNPQYNYLPQRANIYFQEEKYNYDDSYDHMNEIAESQYGKFIAYIEDTGHYTTEAQAYYDSLSTAEQGVVGSAHTFEDWVEYANDNGIDYSKDPKDDFVYVSEDLSTINGDEPWNSDRDFTDMSLNLKKIYVPEPIDISLISADSVITTTCTP